VAEAVVAAIAEIVAAGAEVAAGVATATDKTSLPRICPKRAGQAASSVAGSSSMPVPLSQWSPQACGGVIIRQDSFVLP
jgi:hypothetical protein